MLNTQKQAQNNANVETTKITKAENQCEPNILIFFDRRNLCVSTNGVTFSSFKVSFNHILPKNDKLHFCYYARAISD